jgi:hypothetical protein
MGEWGGGGVGGPADCCVKLGPGRLLIGGGGRCPRSPAGALLGHVSVHESVDDLCKKAASLWAGREILGIAVTACAHVRASTWENTIHALCTKEELTLSTCRAAMADKEAERLPEIYPPVMQAPGS